MLNRKSLPNNVKSHNSQVLSSYAVSSAAGDEFHSTSLPAKDKLISSSPFRNPRRPTPGTRLKPFGSLTFNKLTLPYFEHAVQAGYPTNIEDPFTRHLDLSAYLIRHPKTAYYFKVFENSMIKAGINPNDLLVVDTALKPKHRDVVIAVVNGEFILSRLYRGNDETRLLFANPEFSPLIITKDMGFFVQGVVTTVIRTFNPLPYDNHFKDISYPHF